MKGKKYVLVLLIFSIIPPLEASEFTNWNEERRVNSLAVTICSDFLENLAAKKAESFKAKTYHSRLDSTEESLVIDSAVALKEQREQVYRYLYSVFHMLSNRKELYATMVFHLMKKQEFLVSGVNFYVKDRIYVGLRRDKKTKKDYVALIKDSMKSVFPLLRRRKAVNQAINVEVVGKGGGCCGP